MIRLVHSSGGDIVDASGCRYTPQEAAWAALQFSRWAGNAEIREEIEGAMFFRAIAKEFCTASQEAAAWRKASQPIRREQ
jgi:hypothetical protein